MQTILIHHVNNIEIEKIIEGNNFIVRDLIIKAGNHEIKITMFSDKKENLKIKGIDE